jgi:hypothetical protein
MKHAFFGVLVLILCSVNSIGQERLNTLVLLDLSDRILQSGQDKKDIGVINAVFAQFEEHVRKQLYLKSEDAFRVVIPNASAQRPTSRATRR